MSTVFPFEPDRDTPIVETLEYLTNVIAANDDTEQRILLRPVPRKRLTFAVPVFSAREAALLEATIYGAAPGTWRVPAWQDECRITTAASAGAATIRISNSPNTIDLINGQDVLLWRDDRTWEVVTATTAPSTVTVGVTPTTLAWSVGDRLIPLWDGLMTLPASIARQTRDVAVIGLEFLVSRPQSIAFSAVGSFTPQHVVMPPNWVEGSWSRQLGFSAFRLDGNVSGFKNDPSGTTTVGARAVSLVLDSRQSIEDARDLFKSVFGRQQSFWAPTWANDLQLASAVAATDTALTVISCGYSGYLAASDNGRRWLALIDRAHAVTPVYVTAATTVGANEVLTLSAAVGAAYATTDIVSFNTLVRFASDSLAIQWLSRSVATIDTGVVELPKETPAG